MRSVNRWSFWLLAGLVVILFAANCVTLLRLRRAEERIAKLTIGNQTLEARVQELNEAFATAPDPSTAAPIPMPSAPPTVAPAPPDPETTAPAQETAAARVEEEYVPQDEVRRILDEALDEHFRELDLSEEQRDNLAGAVYALREAQREMQELSYTVENAERLRQLRAQRERSWETFERITNMTPTEFMRRVEPQGGINNDQTEDETIELRTMDALRP